jgi:hypothetical protein
LQPLKASRALKAIAKHLLLRLFAVRYREIHCLIEITIYIRRFSERLQRKKDFGAKAGMQPFGYLFRASKAEKNALRIEHTSSCTLP